MVVDFIKEYAKLIVVEPDFIEVEQRQLDENYYEIIIYAGEKTNLWKQGGGVG
jgi:predicted RNA-binding protein YlqC (UPF0109 family)